MGLFSRSPVWMTDDKKKESKAVKAIGQINGLSDLKEIVFHAPLEEVRCAALERINDETILEEIVMDDSVSMKLKEIAVSRISNRNILKEIVLKKKNVRSYDLRWTVTPEQTKAEPVNAALTKINDPTMIKEIVFSGVLDDDARTMIGIIDKLPDQETVERATKDCSDLKIIVAAWKRNTVLKREMLPKQLMELGCDPKGHFIAVCSRCGETVEYFESWSRHPLGFHGEEICDCNKSWGQMEGPRYMHYSRNGFCGSAYTEQFWEIKKTTEPISDDEIAICPICSGLRQGTCEALKDKPCTCEYKDLIKPLTMRKRKDRVTG